MSGRTSTGLCVSLLLGLGVMLSACGSDDNSDVRLLVAAEWRDDFGSAAEIGYWVQVDVGWPSRAEACTPIPHTVHATVNDRDAGLVPFEVGDCVWDMLFAVGPFAAEDPSPLVVRVLDGSQVVGQATFTGMFPGFPARLSSPVDGKVRSGDDLVMSLLEPLPADIDLFDGAQYVWLDPADSVPPFFVYGRATLGSDRQSISVTTPSLTGRAAVTIETFYGRIVSADSCAGFTSCAGQPSSTVGPVYVEVLP